MRVSFVAAALWVEAIWRQKIPSVARARFRIVNLAVINFLESVGLLEGIA